MTSHIVIVALRCAALRCAALRCAALRCAALRCAALRCAALRCAALRCAALRCAALRCAALRCAALRCAALRCAALRCAALRCAALRCAALRCAALRRAVVYQRIRHSDAQMQKVARQFPTATLTPPSSPSLPSHFHFRLVCRIVEKALDQSTKLQISPIPLQTALCESASLSSHTSTPLMLSIP